MGDVRVLLPVDPWLLAFLEEGADADAAPSVLLHDHRGPVPDHLWRPRLPPAWHHQRHLRADPPLPLPQVLQEDLQGPEGRRQEGREEEEGRLRQEGHDAQEAFEEGALKQQAGGWVAVCFLSFFWFGFFFGV